MLGFFLDLRMYFRCYKHPPTTVTFPRKTNLKKNICMIQFSSIHTNKSEIHVQIILYFEMSWLSKNKFFAQIDLKNVT